MLAVVFGDLIVLPIAIMAYMRPKAAAVCLSISFLIFETALVATGDFRVAFLGGLVLAVPTGALVWGYTYVASIRGRSGWINSSGDSPVAG